MNKQMRIQHTHRMLFEKKNEIYFNFLFASANNVPYFRLLNPNRAIVIIHIISVCGSNSEDGFFFTKHIR